MKHFFTLFLLLAPAFLYSQHFSTSTIQVKPLPAMPVQDVSIEAHLNSFPETAKLTPETKEWFYWTNFSRSKPKIFWDSVVAPVLATFPNLKSSFSNSLKSDLYATNPLPLLKPNIKLATIAQFHADALKKKGAPPSHTSPSGATFQSRMIEGGIQNCAGENISFGPSNTILALIFLYIDEGIPDLGHRKSLLSANYKEMGIGLATYSNGNTMIIQDFGCDQ